MNCINCYQEVPEGAKFCPHCGAKQPEYSTRPESRNRTEESLQPQTAGQGETAERQETEERRETVVQPEAANRSETVVQPEAAEQGENTMRAEAADGADAAVHSDAARQQYRTDSAYRGTYQNENAYQNRTSYQNENAYQSNSSYQNGNGYQSSAGYPGGYRSEGQQNPVNWVPYLVLSIVSTICCCNLFSVGFGIVGIVYSTKINSAVNAGDYQEAQDAAKKARIWIIVAFAVGVVANIIGVLFLSMGGWGYYYY